MSLILMLASQLAMAPATANEVDCDDERVGPPARRIDPLAATDVTVPTSVDPLGGFLPSFTSLIRLEPARVPIDDLPDGASHQLVSNSLAGLGRLRRLELQRTAIENLEPLRQLEALEVLWAFDTAAADLEPLTHLTMLRELDLRTTRVSDIAPVRAMPRLRLLALDETPVSDIRPATTLRCLEVLTLDSTPIQNLRGVGKMRSLRHLSLAGTKITNLWPVARATELRVLDLSHTPVTDLRPLARLKNLRKLSLRGTDVTDIRALSRLTGLEEIDLRDTPVSLESLDALIDALPYTTVHTHAYREEIRRLEALEQQRDRAMHDFTRATDLWRSGDRQMEALDLAREALMLLQDTGAFAREEQGEVSDWLRERDAID